jgi:hypothetical protein
MRLTEEQDAAVAAFMTGENLRVVAYAGAGKTSTLRAMAQARGACGPIGLYMAFNKAIATEAQAKFGYSTQCRTAHSLAYRTVRSMGYSDDKMRTALTGRTCGNLPRPSDVDAMIFKQLVLGAVRRFCQSSDGAIDVVHVPKPARPMEPEVRRFAAHWARDLWSRCTSPTDATPLGHDGYLKLWALGNPDLAGSYGYVMVDEAQDLNPVIVGVLARQRCQVVAVGDAHQAIYGWRGAVDALDILPGWVCRLTQSFRFGGQIAEHADALLRAMGEEHPLRGNGGPGCVSTPDCSPSAVLCRTNAGVMDVILAADGPVHVPGGASELAAVVEDAARLKRGQPAQSGDLLGFETWRQVQEYADTDDGAGLRTLVALVDQYGCSALQGALGSVLRAPQPGCLTVSTAHKAKGLEWDDVEIYNDFARTGDPCMAERRLFYVACTRARSDLLLPAGLAKPFLSEREVRHDED